MDDVTDFYKSRLTVLEMLKDRGFEIPDILNINFNDCSIQFYNKQCELLVSGLNEPDRKTHVKWFNISKIKPNLIRDHITFIREKHLPNINDTIIIILKEAPNNTITKIVKESDYKSVQIFWIKHLIINITKHIYVPRHILITPEELSEIIKIYSLESKHQLPSILSDDPVAKYYGAKTGQVFKIIRPSETGGEYISYRCVK